MSSTKSIKRRIKSATNISQITKAMEMVAASKMRHAQDMALSSRPYTEKMRDILTEIVEIMKKEISHFLLESPVPKTDGTVNKNLVIVLSSDKGLCGGLNSNLYRGLEAWQTNLLEKNPDLKDTKFEFITIGKKAREYIMKTQRFLLAEFPSYGDKPSFADTIPLYEMLFNSFQNKEYQKVYVVFMEFISTIVQRLSVKQLLPIQKESIDETFQEIMLDQEKKVSFEFNKDYLFEPDIETVFNQLLPKYLGLYLYHIILESIASEHSARMVAMKSAHDNATDIVKELSLEYNQLRQQKITNELLDSISARMVM